MGYCGFRLCLKQSPTVPGGEVSPHSMESMGEGAGPREGAAQGTRVPRKRKPCRNPQENKPIEGLGSREVQHGSMWKGKAGEAAQPFGPPLSISWICHSQCLFPTSGGFFLHFLQKGSSPVLTRSPVRSAQQHLPTPCWENQTQNNMA